MTKKDKTKNYSGKGLRVTAAVFAAVGAALYFIPMTGMRFSGLLLMLGAVYFSICALLLRYSERSGPARRLLRAMIAFLMIGLLIFALLEGWIICHDDTDEERKVSAVIVLGAGVNGREPSLSLTKRLEAALGYLSDKPGIPVVVSGGRGGGEEITEARCMADWLTEHGLEECRIILEERASNTRENIDFSLALLRAEGIDTTDNIAVVTSDSHLARAAVLFGTPNMVPVAAHMPACYWPLTVNYYAREAFGLARAMVLHR